MYAQFRQCGNLASEDYQAHISTLYYQYEYQEQGTRAY
jgi:hypothetical protein